MAFVCLALAATRTAGDDAAPFKVIVNASNTVAQLPRGQLALLYLDRSARWKDRVAEPVDQSLQTPIRDAFSRNILKMTLSAVRRHWENRMIKMREAPPPVKSSDDEVIAHVTRKAGGIGYVSEAAVLPDSVRAVPVVE